MFPMMMSPENGEESTDMDELNRTISESDETEVDSSDEDDDDEEDDDAADDTGETPESEE